jgi:sugar phosphate isomerase/epimerase
MMAEGETEMFSGRSFTLIGCLLASMAGPSWADGPAKQRPANPFYAMDTAFQRAGLSTDQQFDLVKELGYASIAWTETTPAQAVAAAERAEKRGLKIFAIYCQAKAAPDGKLTHSPDLLKLMEALKGRGTIVWLHIGGKGPAFDALTEKTPLVQTLRDLAEIAATNDLRIAVYPHVGEWTAHFGDATKLARVVNHNRFGVTFNLCHCLAMGDEDKIPTLLDNAKDVLFTATINGADSGVKGGQWNRLIQTLDKGTFDTRIVLRKLDQIDFRGPIGFQGYGIKGDARSILQPTMDAWRKLSAVAPNDAPRPVKVFILAGQSNMEGQAVVDLDGKNYNDGKGTLKALMNDPNKARLFKHLKNDKGEWTVREDVWVRYQREKQPLLAGPLSIGFSINGGKHHFGPELQFGHVVGDHVRSQVLLIKTAWGGKSLYKDFRSPSSRGEVGPYYKKMLAEVRLALDNLKTDFPSYKGQGYELAGFVWYQGWNDGVDPKNAVPQYEENLVNLIKDVRKDLNAAKLPVVIGELTGPWVDAPGAWATLRAAQASAANRPEFRGNVIFVETRQFVRPAKESPNPGHGHHEFGNAETYFLVGDALGKGMVKLLTPAAK